MPLYVADYLGDTQHLSAAEHGAYLLLIMHYWQKGALPTDDRQLARICRMSDPEFSNAKALLQEFFAEGWRHERIEFELEKAKEKNSRRVEAGRRGGKAERKPRPSNAGSNAQSNAKASSSQPQSDSVWVNARRRVSEAFAVAGSPNVPDTSRVEIWKSRGHDPEICLSVVSDLLSRKPSISNLSYFDQAIADAHVAPTPQARDGPQARRPTDGRHDVLNELRAKRNGTIPSDDRRRGETDTADRGAVPLLERFPQSA